MKITYCLARHRPGAIAALLCVLGTTAFCWAGGSANAQTPDAFAQNKRLGRGVNVIGYDPLWKDRQKARFQEKYFRLIQEAGFSHVRVNLHPFRDAKLGENYQPSAAWFETLDWAVKQAVANRLMVILDFHEFQVMGGDPTGNKDKFLAVWRQIAEHCKDAPDDVVFEILNEPNKRLTPELWNPMLREALRIIRQSNPHRTVIVGPSSWNGIKDIDKLVLPDEDRNLIVTVHYYSPFPFTHQGAAFAGLKDKTGVPWNGTEKEQQAILKDFDKAQAWAEKHHRPIYLGEFGVYDKADIAARVRWTSFVTRQAEKRSWSWAWWQFDGDFVLYDVRQDHWVEPIRRALVPESAKSPAAPSLETCLLFSYFVGNGEDGLHLARSNDGYHWQVINGGKSFLAPQAGKSRLMRDPCLFRAPDGTFHLVWTNGWKDQTIGYASSKDLLHWSEQQALGVMAHEPQSMNCWAPEVVLDEAKQQYVIFWSTTILGRFPQTNDTGDGKYNHRIYSTTTKDFKTFTPTRLFFDGGFNVIDATMLHADGKYYLIVKDETLKPVKKNLRIAVGDSPEGPFGPASAPFTPSWVEGPTAIRIGDDYVVYFDCYTKGCYGAVRSRNLKDWEDAASHVSFPKGARHGTVLRVPTSVVDNLSVSR